MKLLDPLVLGSRSARNRVVFGPHETNLARRRAISDRHVAYYRRRAAGGAGVIVVEEASVCPDDWPYERAPLAAASRPGWRAVADACHGEGDGVLVLAALGHAGGQGSSAYSQAPLWAPSRVPDVNTREVPKWMEADDIEAVVAGFADAAGAAVEAGCDGVEVNAGQHSLVRQFLSGLTNHRDDEWGADRLLFARRVLEAVRSAVGDAVVGLRLSCDEMAPWAGITPEAALEVAAALAPLVDAVTVVRGSIYTAWATRPDGHVPQGFNLDLASAVRAALPASVAVVAQGSIVDWAQAASAVDDGLCDGVEMTRAQIADAELVAKLRRGDGDRVRPCILCNQACQVRDPRNPIVSCVVDPRSGHEWEGDASDAVVAVDDGRDVLVVGAGVAGLECARVAAQRGHRVTLVEKDAALGGMARVVARAPGRHRVDALVEWLVGECERLLVKVETDRAIGAAEIEEARGAGIEVVLCTGSRPRPPTYDVAPDGVVLDAADVLAGSAAPNGAVLVWDPIGGPIGVATAEVLRARGHDVHLATPDLVAGNELSRTGDLAPANVRLQSSGVVLERRSLLRGVGSDGADLEDRYTGARRTVAVSAVVDAGHRLPDDALWRATGEDVPRAGDSVAPRTILEAVLEGRRRAGELA